MELREGVRREELVLRSHSFRSFDPSPFFSKVPIEQGILLVFFHKISSLYSWPLQWCPPEGELPRLELQDPSCQEQLFAVSLGSIHDPSLAADSLTSPDIPSRPACSGAWLSLYPITSFCPVLGLLTALGAGKEGVSANSWAPLRSHTPQGLYILLRSLWSCCEYPESHTLRTPGL